MKDYNKFSLKNILKILGLFIVYILVTGIPFFLILYFIFTSTKVEVNSDISLYNNYIGPTAKEEYKSKWGIDEYIFPSSITSNMNVLDYKMVYYNPWDAQYLSYLVVEYNDEDYLKEKNRLISYKSNEYIGYYSVTGFTKYSLLAIYADSYNGFIYAITDDNNTIIYVEIIFCNYFMDLDYNNYINIDYLPDGFDATLNNKYSKEHRR